MLALIHACVFSGEENRLRPNQTVLIEGGRILAVGEGVPAPCGAQCIDLSGRFLIPGLIDAHTHLGSSASPERPAMAGRFATYDYAQHCAAAMEWGVTTVRSAGDYTPDIFAFRRRPPQPAPRVLAAGRVFQAKGGHPGHTVYFSDPDILRHVCIEVDETTDVESQVAALAAEGADWIKAFLSDDDKMGQGRRIPRLSNGQLRRIIDAAHRLGKPVMVHVDDPEDLYEAAAAGADTIEHVINPGTSRHAVTDDLLELLTSRDIWVVPTMIATKCFDERAPKEAQVYPALEEAVGRMIRAGVRLGVGCDSGIPFVPYGECVHLELELLVQAGMPPAAALRAATGGNAKLLGVDHLCGAIRPGLAADLVVLNRDPLEQIRHTREIGLVIQEGRIVTDRMLGGGIG